MRKVEYSLIGIVAIFTAIVLPIFNKENVMDFGNSSDIASAFGTLGTLAVAFIALRKAPEWMAQKHYDIVSKVIEEAIYEDLRKLSSLSNQYKILIVQTSMILKKCLNAKDDLPSNMKETLDKVENSLVDFFNLSYSIQNRLKAISRYNYVFTSYTLNIIDEIKHIADYYNNLETRFEIAASEVPAYLYADEKAINLMNKKISDIQRESIDLNMRISKYIKSVYSKNLPIAEFITIKK